MRRGKRGPLRAILGCADVERRTRPGRFRSVEVLECGHLHRREPSPKGTVDDGGNVVHRRRCTRCHDGRPVQFDVNAWEEVA